METIEKSNHGTEEERKYTFDLLPRDTPQYNTGVLLFEKNAMAKFSKLWVQEWQRLKDIDQWAFGRAVYYKNGLYEDKLDFQKFDQKFNVPGWSLKDFEKEKDEAIF